MVETVVVFSLGVDLVGKIGEEVVNCGSGEVGSGPVLGPEKKQLNNIAIRPELYKTFGVSTSKILNFE